MNGDDMIGPTFTRRLFATVVVVVAVLALWYLRHLVLLIFAAVLVAVVLRSATEAICKYTRVGNEVAFALASVAIVLAIIAFFGVLGAQLRAQLTDLWGQLPELLKPLETWFGVPNAEEWLAERLQAMMSRTSVVNRIAGLSSALAALVGNTLLVLVAGFYLAHRPGLYRRGLLLLFPPPSQKRAGRALDAVGEGLQRWLVGQLAAMVMVGILVFLGLSALGMPSALALAVIATVFEFIPFVGPILAAAPAIAIALSMDTTMALWVAGLYLLIQQFEGNILYPLIQKRAVALPPALTLFAILAFGLLFGPLGVVVATPLAVVCMVAVKQLWVRDALHEKVSLPGEGDQP